MKVGDLVRCKYFHRVGVVTSNPTHSVKAGGAYVDRIVWVVWCHGGHSKYKTQYLEVINESR